MTLPSLRRVAADNSKHLASLNAERGFKICFVTSVAARAPRSILGRVSTDAGGFLGGSLAKDDAFSNDAVGALEVAVRMADAAARNSGDGRPSCIAQRFMKVLKESRALAAIFRSRGGYGQA